MQETLRLALITSFAVLLRCCVTYHPHSGEGKPPMYGDYEAQRHWQEITLNLPVDKWYINTTDNDLQYWGLDYPPLTAYHSLLLGHVANRIDPSFVKLQESRGFESAAHKHFMRLTVLIADVLTYLPAIVYFYTVTSSRSWNGRQFVDESNVFGLTRRDAAVLMALIYPGLILIDHGHFQYNCVSLGLFVAAVAVIMRDLFVVSSLLFVLALNYKQMELYHALPFFFYILGRHTPSKTLRSWFRCIRTLAYVSLAVLLTFYIVWMPFLRSRDVLFSVVLRLFPFSRGVFEDKVANVWCAINVVYKLRRILTNAQLAKICLVTTTCAVLPSCVSLYLSPTRNAFLVSLINSALAFFLFSFQVHEKSILLVAVPVLLYFQNDPFSCFWFLIISHFSMLPLFIKDELYLAYLGTMVFYFSSVFWIWPDIFDNGKTSSLLNKSKSKSKGRVKQHKKSKPLSNLLDYGKRSWFLVAFYSSISGVLLLSIISRFVKPPERYPDLFPLLVSIYSCGHFLIFFLYFNYTQLFVLRKEIVASKVKSH
ncbi:probable dolichyl pyrophosphate Man9GlcNAc2 alpha-1,3-glucosyltransferase [Monomorium pharaonis]|uniref:probable dolichyl pyrophosphate Man9GlcNAc2 alpha-1,3-glucosyltransferase n=1 Tax=Monomorium pharaonis TaxID=307658 RepID=UPI00063EF789|nr:probable dolichyl pyrophosphate Man9GlcNAc2 alpha-1,3-glucosyltransferase [Monomorium pharaonis]XP_012535258.1 probable dolichyl pyrophosphate Man9GlcNAc2 alpha-1,3-glucosyltransferase [Monomorium pharaonis]